MTPDPDSPADQPATFETLSTQLAELVARLESGSLGLSESIAAYERGVGIVRRMEEELARAEERVSLLVAIDEAGRPVLQPREALATAVPPPANSPQPPGTAEATRVPRAQRGRSPRGKTLPGMDDTGAEP